MTLPHSLTIYQNGNYNDGSMDLFIENILNNFNHIPGISGELNLAEAFKQKWVEETKCTAELYMKLRCYKLEKVNEYNRPDGIFRKAIINDIETLKKYKIEFNKQNNEPINDDEKLFRSMEDDIKSELYYVWENKKIVSMAKKVRPTKNGMAINNVYTSKEYRNRGYGTAVVSELSKSILNSGKIFCTLFTDLANPISNSIYQKIGYKKVCDNINYSFKFLT
jgi:predicted GNAT family acetyltransferase